VRLGFRVLATAALLSACHSQGAVVAPIAAAQAQAPTSRVELCADFRLALSGPLCVRELTPTEQSQRGSSVRLEYAGANVVRRLRINGRGFPEPDDDDCTEHRYRYLAGELAESTGYSAAGSVCERTLYSDHATRIRWVDAWGRAAFSNDRLYTEERVERDARGFVVRTRFFGADGSPVHLTGNAHELRFVRDAQGLEARTCYFDEHGQPAENGYRAHCLSFERDQFGTDIARQSWGVDDKPSVDFAGGQRYSREVDRVGNVLATHFLRTDGSPISTEDGHCATLQFQYDARGFRTAGACLDGQGRPARYREGNASWRMSPDAFGHTREARYFDLQGAPFAYEAGFARYELERDTFGRVTERHYFLADDKPGQKNGPASIHYDFDDRNSETKRSYFDAAGKPALFKGCAVLQTEYDSFRQAERRSCRGGDGKLLRGSDGVAITVWHYDAKGLMSEERFLDENERPIAQNDGYARVEHQYDALGTDHDARHYAVDGSEVKLPRFKWLVVRVPHSDEFWPGHSREEALGRIESARRELLAGMPFEQALRQFGDTTVSVTHPGDVGYMSLTRVYSTVRMADESLKVGEYSEVVEIPYGFALYQRSE
jgi:hypothetical protein